MTVPVRNAEGRSWKAHTKLEVLNKEKKKGLVLVSTFPLLPKHIPIFQHFCRGPPSPCSESMPWRDITVSDL